MNHIPLESNENSVRTADKKYFLKKQEELELAVLKVKNSKDAQLSQWAHELKNPLTSIILQTQRLNKIMEDG